MRGGAPLGTKSRSSVVGRRPCSGGRIEDDRVAKHLQLADKVADSALLGLLSVQLTHLV